MSAPPQTAPFLPLQQSPAYARTLRALGRQTQTVQTPGVGQGIILERDTPLGPLRALMAGPLWQSDDPAAQIALLRESRAHIVSPPATPRAVMRKAGYWQVMTPAHLGLMDLTSEPLAAMHPKWRNAWRKSTRMGLSVKAMPFDAARDIWILSLDRAQQRVMGYRGYPRPFTLEYARLNPDAAVTYVAQLGADRVAAMIFLIHAPSASYHIGWSGEVGRRTSAHHLILTTAARDFADLGLTTLDLGLIDTQRAPGLAHFKMGAGARPTALGGTWLRLPRWRR